VKPTSHPENAETRMDKGFQAFSAKQALSVHTTVLNEP